ncbi:MAG: VWA domain-containing protein [Defluviitaleaceae bacterium]|nr:VWA domain-containing protein [Defluviitaleaceae bacterium]
MIKLRRIAAFALVFALSFVTLGFVVFYSVLADEYEYSIDAPPIDVVLLIDVSGSMRFTDPNRAALSGAADFIEMLSVGESRVGVIGFSGRMQYYLPLRLLEDEYTVADFRREITAFQYVGYTDIGMALLAAAEMLYNTENLQNPMILLMSDGWIQISRHVPDRTAADSFADVEAALDLLERTVPVYTVGLHNPQGVDVELLEMIAERSDAHAQFTDDANDLPKIFISILEAHIDSIPKPEPEPEPIYEAEIEPEYFEEYEYESDHDYDHAEDEYEYDDYDEYAEEAEPEIEDDEPDVQSSSLLYVLAIFSGLLATVGTARFIRAVMK